MNGQSSAITQNNTALAPLSSNGSSYLSHPMPRINHLSLPTNSRSSASSAISGSHPNGKNNNHHPSASSAISGSHPNGKSSKHHANSSSHLSHPMPRVSHLSLPNSKSSASSAISGKSSKHHGYCSYSDYKSNACT